LEYHIVGVAGLISVTGPLEADDIEQFQTKTSRSNAFVVFGSYGGKPQNRYDMKYLIYIEQRQRPLDDLYYTNNHRQDHHNTPNDSVLY